MLTNCVVYPTSFFCFQRTDVIAVVERHEFAFEYSLCREYTLALVCLNGALAHFEWLQRGT